MDYVTLGGSDLKVSRVCLGTMTWGQQNTEAEGHAQLDLAADRGVNFIDVAEMYPIPPKAETQGRTESILGSWLERQRRERFIIATKITGPGRGFGWVRGGRLSIDRTAVQQAIEGSLKRLRTDYVDLYQIHWPDRYVPQFGKSHYDPTQERSTVPILEQLEALGELVREGKVRHIGLSNETPWGVMQFLKASESAGLPRVVSVQNAYNLLNRTFEAGLSEVTRHENVPLLAYSPLAIGHLTGKYLDGATPEGARLTLFPAFGQRYQKPCVEVAVRGYAALAAKVGLTPSQLALAFVMSRWFCASTIIGARTMAQLEANLGCADLHLDAETLAAIDALHLLHPDPAV